MKIKILISTVLVVLMCSCEEKEILNQRDFQFVKRYCTMVTVGGFIGISERCFNVGEVFVGHRTDEGTVKIRIAEHSPLNDGPPTNASYQEFLEVPSEYLEVRQ